MFGASEEGGDSGWMGVVGAGLLAGLLSNKGQKDTNETNIELGREQMAFQERMSSSAYQRAIADMSKAGINPMLAAQVGGATTPTGAMPTVQNRVGAGIASAGQAMQAAQAAQSISQSKAQEDEIRTTIEKIKSETLDRNLNTAVRAAQVEKDKGAAASSRAQAANTTEAILGTRYDSQGKQMAYRANRGDDELKGTGWEADVRKRKAEARSKEFGLAGDKAEADFYSGEYGSKQPYIKSVMDILRGVSSARRAMR